MIRWFPMLDEKTRALLGDRLIAEQTKVSVSTTRKRLRELKKQGLVELICEAPESEDESSLPY